MKRAKNTGLSSWKRILDGCIIIMALPVWLPVAVIMAMVIWVVSGGPVLFRQERIGYQGRRFTCFKFRTMFHGADTSSHHGYVSSLVQSDVPMTKMDAHGDPRIIPFGRIMRATGLDELPQLINVLKGEMSLTGPRPCLLAEAEKFLPWQRERFQAVPGLTGLWQVSGKNRLTFTQMVQLDIRYVRTMSLWLDLKVIALTIPTLAFQFWDLHRTTTRKVTPTAVALMPEPLVTARGSYLGVSLLQQPSVPSVSAGGGMHGHFLSNKGWPTPH